jgi:hypothetical protein
MDGLHVNERTVYRVKDAITMEPAMSSELDFQLLKPYAQELERKNPGTTCTIETHASGRFKKLTLISQPQLVRAIYAGREVTAWDAGHMKGKWGGQMMVAAGTDGNNHDIQLGISLVGSENAKDYESFMGCLKATPTPRPDNLPESGRPEIATAGVWMDTPKHTAFSDRDKSLNLALDNQFSRAHVPNCAKHVHGNVYKAASPQKFPDWMFWNCVKAITIVVRGELLVHHFII